MSDDNTQHEKRIKNLERTVRNLAERLLITNRVWNGYIDHDRLRHEALYEDSEGFLVSVSRNEQAVLDAGIPITDPGRKEVK